MQEEKLNIANSDGKKIDFSPFQGVSVPARARHCVSPAKDREVAPTKSVQGPLWPYPFLIAWA